MYSPGISLNQIVAREVAVGVEPILALMADAANPKEPPALWEAPALR